MQESSEALALFIPSASTGVRPGLSQAGTVSPNFGSKKVDLFG